MVKSQLSPLQEEILQEFFRREDRFFLSGGAALAGFHLGHRRTADLDIFSTSSNLDAADVALRSAAKAIGAIVENEQTTPDFRRRIVTRGADRVKVDLVVEQVVQIFPQKLREGDVRLDPPEEILANKLCTLLSRSEIRDAVDVYALERAGFSVESALPHAIRKDAGLTPASLAWVLSEIQIGDDASLPGGYPLPSSANSSRASSRGSRGSRIPNGTVEKARSSSTAPCSASHSATRSH